MQELESVLYRPKVESNSLLLSFDPQFITIISMFYIISGHTQRAKTNVVIFLWYAIIHHHSNIAIYHTTVLLNSTPSPLKHDTYICILIAQERQSVAFYG